MFHFSITGLYYEVNVFVLKLTTTAIKSFSFDQGIFSSYSCSEHIDVYTDRNFTRNANLFISYGTQNTFLSEYNSQKTAFLNVTLFPQNSYKVTFYITTLSVDYLYFDVSFLLATLYCPLQNSPQFLLAIFL